MNKIKINYLLIFLTLVSLNTMATAAEFGIPDDIKPDSILIVSRDRHLYKLIPPNPSEYFSDYLVEILPKSGMCSVLALKDYNTEQELAQAEYKVMELLIKKYGDYSTGLWSLLGYFWTSGKKSISLTKNGLSLIYSSHQNTEPCIEETKEIANPF